MTVRLYDSRSQSLRDLDPIEEGKVGIYVCGPTVQSSPHIGHLRSALVYDQWRRWLVHRGYDVTYVRNVTDIEDKILASADAADDRWWALAYRVELEFSAVYAAVGIAPPSYEPRATASVQQMQDLIAELIARGHAYPAADESADVYFDTGSWGTYGELTRQRPEDMAASADSDPRGKRDPRDFALWKSAKDSEPSSAHWASPWGSGRPGWHIECSAMARRYLGDRFDIHGGGLDLRFPHHENELAQSTAAGLPFANHWVHNGLVTVDGQKMSKSIGNSVFAADLLARARPLVVRYLLGAAHYRSTLDYQDGSLEAAASALDRIETFLRRAGRRLAGTRFAAASVEQVPEAFGDAMDDDLGVPQALGVLHDRTTAGNAALDADDLAEASVARSEVLAMTGVLGIDPTSTRWRGASDPATDAALAGIVRALLTQRDAARAARDFAEADRLRQQLAAVGIRVEDTADGPDWSIE